MKVCFAATDKFPVEWSYIVLFTELAARDTHGVHCVTTDPEAADLILFVDPQLPHRWTLDAIRAHPFVSKYPQKTFIYDERDLNWCVLPGIYPSVLASVYDSRRQRAYSYFRDFGTPLTSETLAETAPPDLLFSFMGAPNHKVRRNILSLSDSRAYIEDTSHAKFYDYSAKRDEQALQKQRLAYAEIMKRSKFVLCPRGHGTSSFRIFETLRAGRVPVILSNEWVEPTGPDWAGCSLRVQENAVASLPHFLKQHEPKFEEMSVCASQTYAEWFAPNVIFHRTIEQCQELLPTNVSHQWMSPLFDRQYVRCGKDEIVSHLRYRFSLVRNRILQRG